MADRTRLLLTGADGFLGSHVLEHVLASTDWDVTALDRTPDDLRVPEVLHGRPDWYERVTSLTRDLADREVLSDVDDADYVIAMASGVDVSRSLLEPQDFIRNNVQVALTTMDYCRSVKPKAVILVSTAEVYGPLGKRGFAYQEWAPVNPQSPYAASKAAQEAIAIAYWRSYGVPVLIVNTMNLFGERQDPAKFLPTVVRKVSRGEEVTVHPGSRCWLHAQDLADSLLFLLRGPVPVPYAAGVLRLERYNVAGSPLTVENFARQVAHVVGKPLYLRNADTATARPGYDAHYALDTDKLTAAGWQPGQTLGDGITRTVQWLLTHPEWTAT